MNFISQCKVTRVMNEVSAGTSEQKSSVLDMSGFNGVAFLLVLGTVTDGSVITLAVDDNSANSTSGGQAITNGSCSITASSSSDAVLMVDVYNPNQRYVFADITRTTQNAAISAVIAIQYQAEYKPVSLAGLAASAFCVATN